MRQRTAVILNPASGRAQGKSRTRDVLYRLAREGAVVSLHMTQHPGHARELAVELANQVELLVSVGGDGTLNEVVNGVLDAKADTPVAIIPSGTANVVAEELGLPTKLRALVEIAVHGPTRRLDLGLAVGNGTERRFTMCAGVGFDAAIVDVISRERTKRGITMLDYYIPAMATLIKYDFTTMRVRVDGERVDEKSTFTVIGNMRRYGGPFRFFNKATPDDGLLDVCCLHGRNQIDLLRYGLGTFTKNLPDLQGVAYYMGRCIEIEADNEVLVQVDGDCGGKLPMRFEVLPGAIQFCVTDLDPHGESSSRIVTG